MIARNVRKLPALKNAIAKQQRALGKPWSFKIFPGHEVVAKIALRPDISFAASKRAPLSMRLWRIRGLGILVHYS